MFEYDEGMAVAGHAHRLLTEALDALRAATDPAAGDDDLMSVLTLAEGAARQLDQLTVTAVGVLQRRGVFAARGYRTAALALCDLLGLERFEARRRVLAAEAVCERVGLDGQVLPARLPATAHAFAAGAMGLRHVEVIATALDSPEAGRLAPQVQAAAEAELADKAGVYTPAELRSYGADLLDRLDADGPEPDDRAPDLRNELHLTRHPRGGGRIAATFRDAGAFDAVATLLDATAQPLTADDDRPLPERHADALAEACGWVLDHGEVGQVGGHRPHLTVHIRLEDLQHRARAAVLDLGGPLSAGSLRMLACDAAAIPIVLGGAGQPLDVGRATRTIPDGLRRAVTARDRGCAHPGCGRTPSWCQIHHVHPWEHGGGTELGNLVMVCRFHHRLLHHESGWLVRIRDGIPEFLPPAWIDPRRRPRRKPLPHLAAGV
jgi:hypothetical protein